LKPTLADLWRESFSQVVRAPDLAGPLKDAAVAGQLASWTALLTTAVVRSSEALGYRAAGKGHKLGLLPQAGQEYLGIGVMAFAPDIPGRWPFPLAVFELENHPKDGRVAYSLWKVLCLEVQLRVAFAYLREAFRLDREAPQVRVGLAIALTGSGRHAEGIGHTRTVLRSEPNSAMLHAMLARNLEGLKEDDEALVEHRRAVECDGRNLDAQRGLRNFCLQRGRTEEAMAAWKKALAFDPPDHPAWYGYAELCLYLGHEDE
jgi:tetratricopeptide (TPR) repeat protein